MTPRLIKLVFATMIIAIAAVSPESPQLKAAKLDGPAETYAPVAVIELNSDTPTLLLIGKDHKGLYSSLHML